MIFIPGTSALTDHQAQNARGIIAAVKKRGWVQKAAVIAVEAALTESGMRVIASANVPASQKYPHDLLDWTSDGLGHDHASMGLYQQQTGWAWTPAGYGPDMNQTTMTSANGWGTPAELMDPERSTEKFLNALAGTDWQNAENWHAAQAVQGSAFSDGSNYQKQDARARRIVEALWASVTTTEDDMVIRQDKQTGRRYLLIPGHRAYFVSRVRAQHVANLFGLSIHSADHGALVAWDDRMASARRGVAA